MGGPEMAAQRAAWTLTFEEARSALDLTTRVRLVRLVQTVGVSVTVPRLGDADAGLFTPAAHVDGQRQSSTTTPSACKWYLHCRAGQPTQAYRVHGPILTMP